MESAEGLTFFTTGKRNVGWTVYSMFASSYGIPAEHIRLRVAQLDQIKVYNRKRKQSERYKRREAALAYKTLQGAEKRKQASENKAYLYKDRKESTMLELLVEAAERKQEVKEMSQVQLRAAWQDGGDSRIGMVQCACGWVSRKKHSSGHKFSVAHLTWRWNNNDRGGLMSCGVCEAENKMKVLVVGSTRKDAAKHAAKHSAASGAAAGAAEDANDAGDEAA